MLLDRLTFIILLDRTVL